MLVVAAGNGGLCCNDGGMDGGGGGGGGPTSPPTKESDTFYCGSDYADAESKCEVPCPDETATVCPVGEMCIPFTR